MRQRSCQSKHGIDWSRVSTQIVYLPGAIILLYGLWLTLTI